MKETKSTFLDLDNHSFNYSKEVGILVKEVYYENNREVGLFG